MRVSDHSNFARRALPALIELGTLPGLADALVGARKRGDAVVCGCRTSQVCAGMEELELL